MACQIHLIVQNPQHFDHIALNGAIHNEMPSASAFARDMQCPKVGKNFIAGDATKYVGASFKGSKGFNKRDAVNVNLTLAEGVFGVFEDAGKIFLSLGT